MARLSVLDMLYTKDMNPLEFSFENLTANPLLSYLSPQDIFQLHKIATSVKLSTKPKQKYKMIDSIVVPRGFKKIASGTNRVAYKHLEDTRIVIKIAIDEIGLKDSHREYRNQFLLKPFVTKVFEVSPCGTVGLFERVYPVQTIYEYEQIASDVFDVINTKIIGKYVVDDIGTEYFQNVGVRKGFGVVYLDFPYVYELDGKKLYCNSTVNGFPCGGEIDYDAGFNRLICTKCGARYFAHQLKKQEQNKEIILRKGRKQKMKFTLTRGNNVVKVINSQAESNVLPAKKEKTEEMKFSRSRENEEKFEPDCNMERPKRIETSGFKFSFHKDGEDNIKKSHSGSTTADVDHVNPKAKSTNKGKSTSKKAAAEKKNENVKTDSFKENISESYQNKDVVEENETVEEVEVVEKETESTEIETVQEEQIPTVDEEKTNTTNDDEVVDEEVVMVNSLTIEPREGFEYPAGEEYEDYLNEDEVSDEVETKEVIASY